MPALIPHPRKILHGLLLFVCFQGVAHVIAAKSAAELQQLTERLVVAAVVYDEMGMQAACQELCDQASLAVPYLLPLTSHANSVVRWKAIATLEQMGPVPVQEQAKVLDVAVAAAADADADVRAAAAVLAFRWFPRNPKTWVTMERLVSDSNPVVRSNAWYGRWVAKGGKESIHQLIALSQNSDWMAAEQAAQHLIQIGAPAEDALLEAVGKQLIDSDSATSQARLVRTLAAVSRSEAVQSQLLKSLAHERIPVVQAAARGLVSFGKVIVPEIRDLLEADDPKRKGIALETLAAIGPPAIAAVPQIQGLLRSDSPLAVAAIMAIPRIQQQPDEKLSSDFSNLIESRNPDVRASAIAAVAMWGPTVSSLEAQLIRIQETDPEDYVRQAAKHTLLQITASGKSVSE